MRLIDADALLAAYDREHVGPPGRARKLIEEAPDAQEPVEPVMENDGSRQPFASYWIKCGACGRAIDLDVFCRHCGRKIKWEIKNAGQPRS